MATKDNYTKTLRFSVETDQKLDKLAQQFGTSKFQFFNNMVEYFYRTKKDPADINDEVLKNTLTKNHKAYMGFIKAQEDLLLIPMKQHMDKMISNQRDIVKFFNEQVLSANKQILKHQHTAGQHIENAEKLMSAIQQNLEQKQKLKSRFLAILNEYIRLREELGSFKGREKEELVVTTRKQIENL